MAEFLELLSYPFMTRALIAGSLISVCASIIGVILILRHYALIGHGLSEIGFASLSISSALGLPALYISIPVMIISSFAILFISQKFRSAGDVAIAVASSGALAFGVLVSSLKNSASNISAYLFGSILALNDSDLILSVILSTGIIFIFVIFYNRLFLITYNEDYAKTLGIKTEIYQILISILTALVVVLGMRMLGTLLISSVIILPAVTARNFANGFLKLIIFSGVISFINFIIGMSLSIIFNFPSGACIVLANIFILILVKVLKFIK